MSIITDSSTGTTLVRASHQFDQTRLAAWMESHVDGYQGPLSVEQFKGGQSNPTYKVTTLTCAYVLRRKPPGELLKGAHAVEREARIMSAVARIGYPAPRIFGLCTDDAIIGTWFYIMELVEGRIFWDATFPGVGFAERPNYFNAMNEAIARLHMIDYAALGLSDFGRTGNYFERQINRWSAQYLNDTDAGRDPDMDDVIGWLRNHIPTDDSASIVHGDFRCDNMIFHPTEPRIVAVLDWELSTLGHPLADFTYHTMMYRMPPDIVAGLAGIDIAALNIPSEKAYVEDYCRHVGRTSLETYHFCTVFNFFRMAAIFHGIKGRVLRGTAVSANAKDRARAFPRLTNLANSLTRDHGLQA